MASKKTPTPPVSEDDSSLFREAVGDVKPVATGKQHLTPPKPPARPRQHEADERSVMEELLSDFSENDLLETGEHLSYAIPGVQRSVLKNLKSGKYAIQAELDLHGYNREESRKMMLEFIQQAQQRRHHCVRIIHGKGRRTAEQPPVLKRFVAEWLMRHRRVLAFCSARDSDGGTGAVYVLLRKKQDTA